MSTENSTNPSQNEDNTDATLDEAPAETVDAEEMAEDASNLDSDADADEAVEAEEEEEEEERDPVDLMDLDGAKHQDYGFGENRNCTDQRTPPKSQRTW